MHIIHRHSPTHNTRIRNSQKYYRRKWNNKRVAGTGIGWDPAPGVCYIYLYNFISVVILNIYRFESK